MPDLDFLCEYWISYMNIDRHEVEGNIQPKGLNEGKSLRVALL